MGVRQRATRKALWEVASRVIAAPAPALRLAFGAPPRNRRGDPLDLQTHAMIQLIDGTGQPGLHELGEPDARGLYAEFCRMTDLPVPPHVRVSTRHAVGPRGPIPLTLYRAEPVAPEPGPCVVFYHGGGGVIGAADAYHGVCAALAERAGALVVSVDYRLAPEHAFPAGPEDAVAAFRHVRERAAELGVDPARIAVAGDSAGGNLSAVVCQAQVDAGEPTPALQVLIYPVLDAATPSASRAEFAKGFLLERDLIDYFSDRYFGAIDRRDPTASPAYYARKAELPTTLVHAAGFDPLRDEAEAYADALEAAGVRVVRRRAPGLVHGWWSHAGTIRAAARALAETAADVRSLLG
jgi:acetyl esterase